MTCYNLEYRVGNQMRFRHISFNDDVSEQEAEDMITEGLKKKYGKSLGIVLINKVVEVKE